MLGLLLGMVMFATTLRGGGPLSPDRAIGVELYRIERSCDHAAFIAA